MKLRKYEIIFFNYRIYKNTLQRNVNIMFHKSKTIFGAYRRFKNYNKFSKNNILIKIRRHNPQRDYKQVRRNIKL